MSFITQPLQSLFEVPKAPAMPPIVKAEKPPKETDESIKQVRQQQYSALLGSMSKNKTVGTNPLGVASDVLQTSRKSLLGGT